MMNVKKTLTRFSIFVVLLSAFLVVGCEKDTESLVQKNAEVSLNDGVYNASIKVFDESRKNSLDLEVSTKSESEIKAYLSNHFSLKMIKTTLEESDEEKIIFNPEENKERENYLGFPEEQRNLVVDTKDALNVIFTNHQFQEDVTGFELVIERNKETSYNENLKSSCNLNYGEWYGNNAPSKPRVTTGSCPAFVVVGSFGVVCQNPFSSWLDAEFMGSNSTFIANSYYPCPRVYVVSNGSYSVTYYLNMFNNGEG